MSNSSGPYETTPERTMRAYDKLPRAARDALKAAAFDWAVQPFYTDYRKGARPSEVAQDITHTDCEAVRKEEKKRNIEP